MRKSRRRNRRKSRRRRNRRKSRRRQANSRRQRGGGSACVKTLFPNAKVWTAGSDADLGGGSYYAYNKNPNLPDPQLSVNYSASELLNQTGGGGLSSFFPGNLAELGKDAADIIHNTYRGFHANPKITSNDAYIQDAYISGKHNSVLRK